jgi:hypothetical protein
MKPFKYQNDNSEFHVRNYTAASLLQYLLFINSYILKKSVIAYCKNTQLGFEQTPAVPMLPDQLFAS